eukprot:TRINITY_DN2789_c0_g1_i2.p1 TRINITY_DN2789_c0_g1~~TRINITY_DN2789_c0_g1_i2.p1  ORF type:complete len:699 (+),score=131.94 TRINITY_DN2789_c0_g1_i2:439-2535(+)
MQSVYKSSPSDHIVAPNMLPHNRSTTRQTPISNGAKTPSGAAAISDPRLIVQKALEMHSQNDSRGYDHIVKALSSPGEDLTVYNSLLIGLRSCVTKIKPELFGLVTALKLSFPWGNNDSTAWDNYRNLLIDLMATDLSHTREFLPYFVEKFVGEKDLATYHSESVFFSSRKSNGKALTTQKLIFSRVHNILNHLATVLPGFSNIVQPIFVDKFPFYKEEYHKLGYYVRNLLKVLNYVPTLREKILLLIIENLIKIDVNFKLEDFIDLDDEEDTTIKRDLKHLEQSGILYKLEQNDVLHKRAVDMANKMDILMFQILNFLQKKQCPKQQQLKSSSSQGSSTSLTTTATDLSSSPSNSPVLIPSWNSREVFDSLARVFDSYILLTYHSKYTQFLLFWQTSLLPEQFPELFIGYLLNKLNDQKLDIQTRINCCNYIGSFTARANFIPITLVTSTLELLIDYAIRYNTQYLSHEQQLHQNDDYDEGLLFHSEAGDEIDQRIGDFHSKSFRDNKNYLDVGVHGVFYQLCNSIFYILCFKTKDISNLENGIEWLKTLELETLVESDLNPFKFCTNVAAELSKIMEGLGVWEIKIGTAKLIKNRKIVAPGKTIYGLPNEIDQYYPFEPYLLKNSNKFIEGLYSRWTDENRAETVEELGEEEDSMEEDAMRGEEERETGGIDIAGAKESDSDWEDEMSSSFGSMSM